MNMLLAHYRSFVVAYIVVIFCLHLSYAADTNNQLYAGAPTSNVHDVLFQATIDVRIPDVGFTEPMELRPASTINLKADYSVKGTDKTRITFTSSRSSGAPTSSILTNIVGTTIIISHDNIKIKGPDSKGLTFPFVDAKKTSTFDTYSDSGLPDVTALFRDSNLAKESDWQKSKLIEKQQLNGAEVAVYELVYPAPVPIDPTRTISKARRFVDVAKNVAVKEQDFSSSGDVVQTTNYENFQKDDLDNWVALFSRSTVEPTRASISIPWNTEDGKRELKQTTVPISGRIIERQYELVQGAFHLLSSFRMSDTDGNLILKASFSDFIVNEGIDDSLFDFPIIELTTPAVAQVMPPFSFPDENGKLQGPQQWAGRQSVNVLLLPAQKDSEELVKTLTADKQEAMLPFVVAQNKPNFAASVPVVMDEGRELLNLVGDQPMLAQIDKAGWVRSYVPVADGNALTQALEQKIEVPAVAVGQSAPDFTLTDMDGVTRTLSELKGKKNLLLTFFPKCFTGGCQNHLTSIQNRLDDFKAADTEVWAVSIDSADVQRDFAAMWKFGFPLLPDVGRNLSLLYGAAQNTEQLSDRMSVFIDKAGVVRFIDKSVVVGSHGSDVLKKMDELKLGK